MIKVLKIDTFLKEHKAIGPIKSSQFFLGKSQNPHPDGLFSENIFGIEGSIEYKENYSWIELNCPVIHPVIYDILYKRIERKIDVLLSGEKTFIINDRGYLEENENGDIDGMASLYKNRKKLRFRRTIEKEGDDESDRNKIIDMLESYIDDDEFFMTKLLVLPPAYRPIVMLDEEETRPDPLNEIYQKAIILSSQLSNISGTLFDILAFRMQSLIRDLYDQSRQKVSKKTGMVRKLMLGKRMDFSARAVISPNPKLKLGQVGIPLRVVAQLFEPHILYGLVNSPYSRNIPQGFHDEVKKFLGKESDLDREF